MLAPPTTALAASTTVPVIVPRSPWANTIPMTTNTTATAQTTLVPIERTFPGISPDRKLYTTRRGLLLHSQDNVNDGAVFCLQILTEKRFFLFEDTVRRDLG